MSIVLSLSTANEQVWAAGPEGLFRVRDGELEPVPQPQEHLYCCCAIHDRLLVGGAPFGVAYSLEDGENWQAGWFDDVDAPVVCMAADPQVEASGIILAGTDGAGLLRSTNRGRHWYARNFGLHSYNVLAIAWAPPAPANAWPRWQTVFACTEEGVYMSPNGGRGWRRADGAEGIFQTIAVGPDFHATGIVLAGTEEGGLWRSEDGGHLFEQVTDSPQQINALAATAAGWLLSDHEQLWRSDDGRSWTPIPGSQPALVIQTSADATWTGNEAGVSSVETPVPA